MQNLARLSTYFIGMLVIHGLCFSQEVKLSESEAESIATEAWIFGYPLVTMDMTKRIMTNVESPKDNRAPLGQFFNLKQYPDASFKDVTTPNADTLYSLAWLDLSNEPYILHVPDENGRYYLMPMLSGWTDIFASPGTRTTGTKAADFAITGPGWKGTLPEGIQEFKSPTDLVWILGRTYCTGTPQDYEAVHRIQAQYSLKPLSYFGQPYTPIKGSVDPSIDMKTPVRDQVNSLSGPTFFNRLASLMKSNPPAATDASMIEKMAKIGIIPGKPLDLSTLDPQVASAIEGAPKRALEKIAAHEKDAGKIVNGWLISTNVGTYGTDYIQRAFIAYIGLGANLPVDAIYLKSLSDNQDKPLSGLNRYVIRFPKGQIPPVNGFWSLTLYNDQYFFNANPLNRYTLSHRDDLKYDNDGTLTLYIQNEPPGKDKESNWLPAPKTSFNLVLRFYWPKEEIINGSWKPPLIEKVQ